MGDDLRKTSDQVGRTSLLRIPDLWRRRFGREPPSRAELIGWLCNEFDLEASQAEDLTLDQVATRLMQASRGQLSETDVSILQVMEAGKVVSSKEIAAMLIDTTDDYVRRRLMKSYPLRRLGFIEKVPAGYVIR